MSTSPGTVGLGGWMVGPCRKSSEIRRALSVRTIRHVSCAMCRCGFMLRTEARLMADAVLGWRRSCAGGGQVLVL